MRPPVITREMVTGIFQVDDGPAFFEAVGVYESAGYLTAWSVRKGSRHGDCTARLRVFLVAILPQCLREGLVGGSWGIVSVHKRVLGIKSAKPGGVTSARAAAISRAGWAEVVGDRLRSRCP